MRKIWDYIMIAIKGACMGAADVVPGVSGGTIAFITGLYDELLATINSIDAKAFKLLFTGKIKEFWKHINGNFLVSLVAGILLSVVTLAGLMQFLLENFPIRTWAFFFGLIVASSIFILKGIKGWNIPSVFFLIVGIVLGVLVCTLTQTRTPETLWFIFLSGAIAICAMILPGISGSFILLILGKYEFIMNAISGLTSGVMVGERILILSVFAIGAVCGLLAFSRVLNWLLSHFHKQTLLVLAGFIIGSLVKVWPWSNKAAIVMSQDPATKAFLNEELTPTGDLGMAELLYPMTDKHIPGAILFALIGFMLVFGIELLAKYFRNKKVA